MSNKNTLEKLREATAALHQRLEQQNPAQAILDHSMDLETYKSLLLQNYQAYEYLEARIATFLPQLKADKAERLKADLEGLKLVPPSDPPMNISITSPAEAFGAAYVVEGSALGGMVIAKHLKQCVLLKDLDSQLFFNGDKACLAAWDLYKKELASQEFGQAEEQDLLAKARETFLFFENVFQNSCLSL